MRNILYLRVHDATEQRHASLKSRKHLFCPSGSVWLLKRLPNTDMTSAADGDGADAAPVGEGSSQGCDFYICSQE